MNAFPMIAACLKNQNNSAMLPMTRTEVEDCQGLYDPGGSLNDEGLQSARKTPFLCLKWSTKEHYDRLFGVLEYGKRRDEDEV